MILSHRENDFPSLDAHFAEHMVIHSRFRFFVKKRRGIVADDGLFEALRPLDVNRSQLLIALEGDSRIRLPEGDAFLPEGGFFTQHRNRSWGVRQEGKQLAIFIEWEPGLLGTRMVAPATLGRLSPAAHERLREAVLPLTDAHSPPDRAAVAVARVLAILRAEGLPFDPIEAEALREEVPGLLQALSAAVDRALSSSASPMSVDIERAIQRSRRLVHLRMSEFHRRYAFHFTGGWREHSQSWRLRLGAALMSAPGATTEMVAGLLGYSSPRAFCDAFAHADLPSPGAIREVLQRIG